MQAYFVAGGTLGGRDSSYVERRADGQLVESLLRGEFAYVLDSRQKGKSSLMVRARGRLEEAGVRTVLLDLQRFGSNVTAEQWYGSMLSAFGEQLGVEDHALKLWDDLPHAGPMRRFFYALENASVGGDETVVVFVDEIDFVRSLPFSTDEFFAGIRECFNRKATGAAPAEAPGEGAGRGGLTFCLLGVATPSELIQDVQITPFNVGRRIELTDFTLQELEPYARVLSEGGRDGRALVRRIHHWTNGHPYLTQKLAAAVAADASVRSAGGVDRLVEGMFFSVKARAEEANLADVSRRVLEAPVEGVTPEEARARVLDLYQQVRAGRRVRDEETDPVAAVLKLAGLVHVLEGYLLVRNRVYFRAFDRGWVESNLPKAEALRQQRAARQAAMRVGAVAGAVAVAIGGLAMFGFAKANSEAAAKEQAKHSAQLADSERQRANLKAEEATHRAKEAEDANQRTAEALKVAQDEKQRADAKAEEARRAGERATAALAQVTQEKDRAVQARRAADQERRNALAAKARADDLAQKERKAADAERLAREANNRLLYQANINLAQTAFADNNFGRVEELLGETAKPEFDAHRGPEWGYWDYRMNTHLLAFKGHRGDVSIAAFSPDGTRVVTASRDRSARVWDARDGRELAVLKGHTESVASAEFSPDGTRVVTASDDNTARVWDARDGRELAVLKGHTSRVRTAVFSSDGTRVVTAGTYLFGESPDRTARVWDARDGREIAILAGHAGPIQGAEFSPDGTRVVTASDDKTARVWDARDGRELAACKGHTGSVASAEFSPDGTRVLTASVDSTARVWDARDGRELAACKGHTNGVSSASFSPDGTRVATVSHDNTVRVWDALDGRELAVLKGHTDRVASATFSPDGTRVVTASEDKTARVWDARDGRELAVLKGHTGWVSSAAFSPDGTRVVTASGDSTARVWDARDGRELAVLEGRRGSVSSAAFSPDGTRVVTASRDNTVRVWDARDGRELAVLKGHTGWVSRPAFSPEGRRVVTASGDWTARVWDARDGRELAVLKGHTGSVWSAEFSPDGTRVVTASRDNTARVWDARDGWEVAVLKGHTESVASAEFSPDGTRVLTASQDETARVWDARDGREVAVLKGHTSGASSAAFSPDGTRVVTTSFDNTARIWEARDGREVAVHKRLTSGVRSAAFSPDGTRVVTTSLENTARVWDARDGREVAVLKGHMSWVNSAAFSPDGTRVVTTSLDNTVRVWDARDGRELLKIDRADSLDDAQFSPDARFLMLRAVGTVQIVPLSREAAAELTFVHQDQFVVAQLAGSAKAGDLFAWNWQVKNWLTPEIANSEAAQDAFDAAHGSPSAEIAADARKRLTRSPIIFWRNQVDPLAEAGKWEELAEVLRGITGDPSGTITERKSLALVRLHLGDHDGWRAAARGAVAALTPGTEAADVFQAAIAVRAAPAALEDYDALIAALEKAAISEPRRYATAASPGALLFRAGRFEEAEERLRPSVEGDRPSRFGQVFLTITLARLGRTDEAHALLAELETWASVDLDAQSWDYKLELALLLKEARGLLGPQEGSNLLLEAIRSARRPVAAAAPPPVPPPPFPMSGSR